MKNLKVKGHIDNMCECKTCLSTDNLIKEVEVMVEEQEVQNDRVIRVLKKKKLDPRDNFAGYKVSDFYLENLQACGAIANLKNCMLDDSSMDCIDSAIAGFKNLENINIFE